MTRILPFIQHHARILRIIILAVLLTILLSSVKLTEITTAFTQIRSHYLLFALIIAAVKILLQLARWHFLLGALDPKPSLWNAVVSLFGGFFLGAVTPSRMGELARGLWIDGYSQVSVLSLTVIEKGFNQAVIVFFGLLSLGFVLPWPVGLIPVAGELLLAVGLFSVYRIRPFWKRILSKFFSAETVENTLAAFTAISPDRLVVMLCLTLAVYCSIILQFYVVLRGFYHVPLEIALRVLPLIFFVDILLPFSFGDFGVKETASVTLLGYYGIGGGIALSASFTNNVLSLLLPALIGGIIVVMNRFRRGRGAPSSSAHDTPS